MNLARRAGGLVLGTDGIGRSRERLHAVFTDGTLSPNGLKTLSKFAVKSGAPLIITPVPLAELVHKTGCRAAALTNADIWDGIKEHLEKSDCKIIKG